MKKNEFLKIFGVLCVVFLFTSCGKDGTEQLKPAGQVRLEYPSPTYQTFKREGTPYIFEYSIYSKPHHTKEKNWYVLNYQKMNADIYLTYYPINGREDLAIKIKDSERLVHKHTVKASYISPQEFSFEKKKVYGTLFELGGEAAINLQFHLTDSSKHLLSGSVYFSTVPKPDSLAPSIDYLKNDVKHLIETFEWSN